MKLLALDTCTERLIVAVRTGEGADRWTNNDSQGNHARDLIAVVKELLVGRPDAVGVAVGPGSFTGVRIGLSVAKGLAEGWGVPLVGLDNLAAMASSYQRLRPNAPQAVLPIIDARKKKFYGALYGPPGPTRELVPPSDLDPDEWVSIVQTAWKGPVAVSGYQGRVFAQALSLPDQWTVLETSDWAPELLDQLERGWKTQSFLSADEGPRYLRLSEAEEHLRLKTQPNTGRLKTGN